MIKRSHFSYGAALAVIATLAACGGGAGGGGGGGAMEPGEWETTVEVTKMDIGNLPPEMRQGLQRRPAGQTERQRGCWTMSADVVRIENLRFTIPDPYLRNASCTFAEMVMEGGTLRARMSCSGLPGPRREAGGNGTMTVTGEMNGSYTPNSVQATARGEIRFGANSGSGEMRITSRRIGACPPPPRYRPPVYGPDMGEGNMLTPVPVPVPMPAPMAVPPPRPPAPRIAPPAPPRMRPGNSI